MKDNLKVLAVVSVLVLSVVLAYIFIVIPNKNKKELRDCLIKTDINKTQDWNSHCKMLELEDSCYLPKYNADIVEKHLKDNQNTCFRLWE